MKKFLLLCALNFIASLSTYAQTEIMVVKTKDGKTTEFVTGNIEEVSFTTDATYFEYPYVNWDASSSDVKAEMKKRGYYMLTEQSNTLLYVGKYMEEYDAYTFVGSTLSAVSVFFKQSVVPFSVLDVLVQNKMDFLYIMDDTLSDGTITKVYFTKEFDMATITEVDVEGEPYVLLQIMSIASSSQKKVSKDKIIEAFYLNKDKICSMLKADTEKLNAIIAAKSK